MTPLESVALAISEANCGSGENPRDWLKYYLPDATKALEGIIRADEQGWPVCMKVLMLVAERHGIEFTALHAAFLDIVIEISRTGETDAVGVSK